MSERKDIFWRAYLIYFGFVILMLIVLIKTVTIQFEGGGQNFMTSSDGEDRMPTRVVKRTPRRGQILDSKYSPLVTSVTYYDIHMDPTVVDQELWDRELSDLCIALNDLWPDKTAAEYERIIRKGRDRGRRYISIRKKATNEERKKLHEMPVFKEGRLKGGLIDNEQTIERKLPHGQLLKRTLGYVKDDDVRNKQLKVGIEGAFNEFLAGEPGEEIEQLISNGWKKTGPIVKEPVEGANVVTTIDMEIQEVAHAELLNQLKKQDAASGTVVVMEVKTGYVKAIVNLTKGSDGEFYESYNKAVGWKEVPGSTFKLASLMALLEDGKVRLSDKVNAKGVYKFYNARMEDSNNGYGYGEITIKTAFEKSSNVFTQIVNDAYKRNPRAFIDRLKSFGLGDSLGVSISGEPRPTLYEPGMPQWSGLSLPWMAIGYEVQQTPLQTLAFYNAVANNGTMVRPQFVQEVHRANKVVQVYPPEIMINKICSDNTLADLQACLKGVVESGTGKALKSANFDIAGKTGTARILDNNTTSASRKKYQASFVGYFPADDPIYSCIVLVSDPTNQYYGSVVSGTVFTTIADKVYSSHLQYHDPINQGRKKKEVLPVVKAGSREDLMRSFHLLDIPYGSTTEEPWVNANGAGKKMEMSKRYVGIKTVPNVIGMTARDAVFLIERTGMQARVEGYGKVVEQSIEPGTEVFAGGAIVIKLK